MSHTTSSASTMDPQRDCLRCKGVGSKVREGFTYGTKVYPTVTETCTRCRGAKQFTAPDLRDLYLKVTTSRGMPEGKRKVRASADKKWNQYSCIEGARAYYVWRMVRFDSGRDVTMPMMAGIAIGGDPYEPELSALAGAIAKAAYGTDMAGAARWGVLLGAVKEHSIPQGLPSSAYEGGPEKLSDSGE